MQTHAGRGCVDRAPFVGRRAELDRLGALLDRIDAGGPAAARVTAVDLTGEAGAGKSRLLTEFAARARARGLTVLRGRAVDDGHAGPFQVFTDALGDLDHTHEDDPASRLGALFGGGGAGGGSAGRGITYGPGGSAGAAGRSSLLRRAAAALGRVPGPGLVLLLDDLHGADASSLELLDHLLRHPVRTPFLLVAARRERQTPPDLAAALARGIDTGAVTRLTLGPLDRRDCVELAPGLPVRQAEEAYTASQGSPLYFLALVHARSCAGTTGPEAHLLGELAPLPPLQRAVVEAVAVLGDQATPELVRAVTAAGPDDLAEALRQVARRDLVRHDGGGHRLLPRHPAMPRLVRRSMDPWRRQEFHRRAAAELSLAGAAPAEQARHREQAMTRWDPAGAAVLVRAAAETEATAPGRAARWLNAVLRLLPDTCEHRRTRRELTLLRARALGAAGRVEESRDLLHRLIDGGPPAGGGEADCRRDDGADCRQHDRTGGARDGVPHAREGDDGGGEDGDDGGGEHGGDDLRISAVLLCAFMERHLGRYPEADALLRRELERVPGPRPARRLGLVVEWGCRALFATRYPEVRGEVARVLADARARGDEAGAVEALTLAALGEAYEGDVPAARSHADQAAALVDVLTDGALAAHCESLVRLGWSEVFLDRYADAERHSARGIAIARRGGRPFALSQLLMCAAYVRFTTGRVAAALELADESLAVAQTLGGAELLGFTRATRAAILLHARPLGDPAGPAAAEEAAATVSGAEGWWAIQARSLLAYAIPAGEDPDRVRDVLTRAGGGRDLPRIQSSVRPSLLELLVAADLVAGDPAEAERGAARATELAERLDLPVQRGAALRGLGRLQAHRGDPAAAARSFTEAARLSARSGATLREAQSLLLGAPFAKAAGDGPGAVSMWRRGRRLAADGGARMLTDLAERLRPAVLGPGPTGPAGPGEPAGPRPPGAGGAPARDDRLARLTPREREISALVAEGLTNQAVADRLGLSPRTVESHVARVYRKTGVVTRAALASLVVRGGLADGDGPPPGRTGQSSCG
ncbi:AAA family ATPase [Streptomyces sp. JL2001]|uniref:helix-turn-helix transcriptional regulator n=1 Tax=Streptomyces sp. JL2001 TaxID=3342488 RepID=UPI003D804F4C